MSRIDSLTVIGSGVLGGQIAWHSAAKGKTVSILDISEEALNACRVAHDVYAGIYQKDLVLSEDDIAATRSRLSYVTDMAEAVSHTDLVIEAVPEVPEIKQAVYSEMAPLLPEHALIATNSSTLLPSDFAELTGRPEKFCALHFANLIWMMNVVEVMAHETTALDTLTAVTEFGIEIGMRPVPVRKEHNGYIINTWFGALLNSAQTLITNGVATPEDVDRTFLMCNPGAPTGPCGMIDVVGMHTAYNVMHHWGSVAMDEQVLANAHYIKTHFIDNGLMGLQSGQGYYSYPNPAYSAPGFTDVPAMSKAAEIAALARFNS